MAGQTIKKDDLPENAVIVLEDEPEASEAEIEETEALNNMLADLGELDNVKVTVYRVKEGNKTSWVDSFAPSELDIEQLMMGLRADYGGGRFKIQVRESGRIKKSKIVEVEPPPKKPDGVDTREVMRELQQQQQADTNGMAAVLAEIVKSNQAAQQHQSEQMTAFMQTMVTAISGQNQNAAPPPDPIAMQNSMIQSLVALKELSSPEKQTEPTELILKGVELVNAIRGDEGGGDANIYSVLSNAVKSFGGTLGQAMEMQRNAPNPQQLAVPPPQQQQQIAAPTEEGETEPGVTGIERLPADHPMAPFEPYVDYMLNLAKKDANPELYAEVIVDQMGIEFAHAWLATPEGLQTLQEQIPRTREHISWFMLVGQVVDEMWQEEQNQPVDESHQDGDVPSGQPGHDSPSAESAVSTTDQSPSDGDTERASGDQSDIEDNVAVGVTSENGHTYS